eukprot:12213126-Alexandrium_andersonii.AAC.1
MHAPKHLGKASAGVSAKLQERLRDSSPPPFRPLGADRQTRSINAEAQRSQPGGRSARPTGGFQLRTKHLPRVGPGVLPRSDKGPR